MRAQFWPGWLLHPPTNCVGLLGPSCGPRWPQISSPLKTGFCLFSVAAAKSPFQIPPSTLCPEQCWEAAPNVVRLRVRCVRCVTSFSVFQRNATSEAPNDTILAPRFGNLSCLARPNMFWGWWGQGIIGQQTGRGNTLKKKWFSDPWLWRRPAVWFVAAIMDRGDDGSCGDWLGTRGF